jgi:hypothetical protein
LSLASKSSACPLDSSKQTIEQDVENQKIYKPKRPKKREERKRVLCWLPFRFAALSLNPMQLAAISMYSQIIGCSNRIEVIYRPVV